MGTRSRSALAMVLGLVAGLAAAGQARAQEPAAPILMTIETSDDAVDPAAIREALAEALGLPVVSLWHADAEQAGRAINVAFEAEGRRAQLRVQAGGVRPRWDRMEASEDAAKDGTWIVPEIARVLHEMRTTAASGSSERLQGCLDVLDPWRNTIPGPALAPWDASHYAQATPVDEEMREARRNERADGLTPPEPARR